MTALEPIFASLVAHLQKMLHSPYEEPNDALLDEIRFNLTSKSHHLHDLTLLKGIGEPILQIVHSNETTMVQKAAAVDILVVLLPLYSFEDVVLTFGESPVVDAILMGRQHDLQKVVVKLLTRVQNPDKVLSNTVIESVFAAISDPMVYYGVFDELHRAVVHLAKHSANFREQLMSNPTVKDDLLRMKQDGILQSRLTDLAIDLLPYVPHLDRSLYLISEEELLSSKDPLLFAFTIQAYFKLLEHQSESGTLGYLEDEMDEQFDYCSKLFVDDQYGEYIKSGTNADYPEVLGQLSRTFPRKFSEMDTKHHIIDAALAHPNAKQSLRFLSKLDPMCLYDRENFFYEFNLNSDTVGVFYNLVNCEKVFFNRLDQAHFPLTRINLEFTKLLWLVELLIQRKYVLERLTKEWAQLTMSIIKPRNPIADHELQHTRKHILEAIQGSGFELSPEMAKSLQEQVEMARKGIYVMEPATQTS